jgi:hypothetical protein
MNSMKEKYQKVQGSMTRLKSGKMFMITLLTSYSLYNQAEIKDQVLLNTGKSILNDIKTTQKIVEKACKRLWRTSDDLLEQFRMETLEYLEKVGPSQMIIEYVEARRNLSMKAIKVIEEVDKEVLETRIIKPNQIDPINQTLHTTNRTRFKYKSDNSYLRW